MPQIPREPHDDDAEVRDDAPTEKAPQLESDEAPPAEAAAADEEDRPRESRVSVVSRPKEGDDDEYQWHTGAQRPHGAEDADRVRRRPQGLRPQQDPPGPEHGHSRGQDLDDPGAVGTGKSVCIKHMVGLLYPDEGDVLVHGQSVPNMQDDDLFEMRKKFGVLSRTSRSSAR